MENKELTSEGKIRNEIRKLDRKAILIGIFGILVLFIFPIIITQYNLWFDFTNTGSIGDTIGGLTAPIIGVLSSLLIYYSFRAQIKANYIIQNQIDRQEGEEAEKREFNYQMEAYKHLIQIIENYKSNDEFNPENTLYKGSDALTVSFCNISQRKFGPEKVNHRQIRFVNFVLDQFDSIIKSFKYSQTKNFDIRLSVSLVNNLFEMEIWEVTRSIVLETHIIQGKDEDEYAWRIYKRIYRTYMDLTSIVFPNDEK